MKANSPNFVLSMLLAVLMASLLPARSGATDPPYDVDHIGLYRNPDATGCDVRLGAGGIVELQILAVLPSLGDDGLTAVEFKVADLPAIGSDGSYTVAWNTELALGNIATGVALAFSEPLYGEIISLGTITFHALTDDWLGEDLGLRVAQSNQSHLLVIVNDQYDTIGVAGSLFTFNCTVPAACECGDILLPGCLIEPPELDFGYVPVGQFGTLSFTITNDGSSTIFGDISESCADFIITTGTGGFALLPGQSRMVTVRYAPLSHDEHTCLVMTGSEVCADVPCRGTSVPPSSICEVEPDSLDFGSVMVGAYADRSFAINNVGEGILVGTVSESCAEFAILSGGGLFLLNPGEQRVVNVRYEPPSIGEHLCFIQSAAGEENACGPVLCQGSATPALPVCVLDPSFLDFGEVQVGLSVDRGFNISNAGHAPLHGRVFESCDHYMILSGAGDFVLDAGQQRQVSLRFRPTEEGEHLCLVQTGDEGENECGPVTCEGTGLPGQPICEVDPAFLEFGQVDVGQSASETFRITNVGTGFLEGEVTLSDPAFHLDYGGGIYSLGPMEHVDVRVSFEPPSCGHFAALVSLGADECESVPCSGFGALPGGASDHIGIYGELEAENCAVDLVLGETTTLYVLAVVSCLADSGITGAEFRIGNLPAGPGGQIVFDWYADSAGGDPASGITLLFAEAQAGERIALGSISVTPQDADWIGENHVITIEPTQSGQKRVLFDQDGLEWEVEGNQYTFNCGEFGLCDCIDFENPDCNLAPAVMDFGEVAPGQHVDRNFVIANVGYGVMTGHVSLSGFAFNLIQGGGDFSLAHGDSLHGTVRFTYECGGHFEGMLATGVEDCPGIPCVAEALPGVKARNLPTIGVYGDENATVCFKDIDLYTATTVYVMVWLPPEIPGLTAAEFSIAGLPASDCAILTPNWTTPLVIGDLDYGIALAYSDPQPGPWVMLGTLAFFQIDPDCIGSDYEMSVVASQDSGNLVVVDQCYDVYDALGGYFTFNCSDPWSCLCFAQMPVAISRFELKDLTGAVRIEWESTDIETEEFRLEAELGGGRWEVPYARTLPGIYQAHDESSELVAGGLVTYSLSGRLGGEDWMLLSREQLEVTPRLWSTALRAPHPNPFNPTVSIPFSLAKAGPVRVAIYDLAGRCIVTLADQSAEQGEHVLAWRGQDAAGRLVPSGVYFVRMDVKDYSATQKLVLLR